MRPNFKDSSVKRDFSYDNISVQTGDKIPIFNNGFLPAPAASQQGLIAFEKGSPSPNITGKFSYFNGTTWVSVTGGDVVGPLSSGDNALARFDGPSGKIIKNSSVTLSDGGDLLGITTINGYPVPLPGPGSFVVSTAPNAPGTATKIATYADVSGQVIKDSLVTIDGAGSIVTSGLIDAAGIRFPSSPNAQYFSRCEFYGSPLNSASGGITVGVLPANDTKVLQNLAFLSLPGFSSAFVAALPITFSPALPATLHPTSNRTVPIIVINNGAYVAGTMYISTAGVVTIGVGYNLLPGNFTGGLAGIADTTAVYNL